jgi:hypothetical protein
MAHYLDPNIIALLQALHDAGGKIEFPEGEPEPFEPILVDKAHNAGLVRHDVGSFWHLVETVEITNKGREAIGAPLPPPRWRRLLRIVGG